MSSDAGGYEKLECIGRGSYGDVFRGWVTASGPRRMAYELITPPDHPVVCNPRIDSATGKQVAIKVIYLEDV